MRRPPIVGLASAVSIFAIMLLYTYEIYDPNDQLGLAIWLVFDLLIFGLAYRVISMDVQWLELFSTKIFQICASIFILIFTAIIILGVIFSLDAQIPNAVLIEALVIILVLRYIAKIQKDKLRATS